MQLFKLFLIVVALVLTAPAANSAPFAYIPNYQTNTISVVDIATNSETTTIALANTPISILVNPAGTRVYVTYLDSNIVSVIDTANNTVTGNVTGLFGKEPRVHAINPDGSRLYLASHNNSVGLIEVVDTTTNNVIAFFKSGGDGLNEFFAINPAGTRLYVPSGTSDSLLVIDIASQTVLAKIAIEAPRNVAVSLDGTRAYVSTFNVNGTRIAVINTATNNVINTIVVDPDAGNFPNTMTLHPDGKHVYVGFLNSNSTGSVAVIDTNTNKVVESLAVGTYPTAFAWNLAATALYVVDASNLVSVINLSCNDIASFTVGSQHTFLGNFMAPILVPLPPPVIAPTPLTNLQITGMEVTQGIQDLAGSVPLISGRRTFVRVYVKSTGAAVPGVTAALTGLGNIACTPGLCPPVGTRLGPIIPVNTVGSRITVRANPKRSNLDDSFLFELPWQWTNYKSLRLRAILETGPEAPALSCPKDILSEPLHEFQHPTTLKVQFVRLSYRLPGTFNGITNALIETSLLEQRQTEAYIRRTYPLSDLLSAPDYTMYDAGLGSRVDRSAFECKALDPDKQSLCAHNYITSQLAALQATSGTFFGLIPGPPGSGFIGEADAAYALIPQVPNDTTGAYFTRGACCTNRIGAGPSNDQGYAAHEIGHFLGRMHPVEGSVLCGHSSDDADYPYFISLIAPPLADMATGMAGFDGGDASLGIPMSHRAASIVNPTTNKAQNNFDFMGYCKPDWISDYTYNNLYICLASLNSDLPGVTIGCPPSTGSGAGFGSNVPQLGNWLTVFGKVSQDSARADFITRRVDSVVTVPPRSPGNLSIRLLDAGGAILADYPFTPEAVADSDTSGGESLLSFGHVVAYVTGTQSIQIVDTSAGNQVLGAKSVSSSPPDISNVAFDDLPDPATGLVTVSWTASDSDGDPLSFDLFFSRENGESLQPLMLGLSGSSVQVDTADLSGGVGKFRLVASDGVQTTSADTTVFTLANKPPRPRILTPAAGATVHEGQLVNFAGEANDPQDGVIPEEDLAWSIPGKSLGSGSKLSISDLPLGVNIITLIATNSDGLSESSTVSINVIKDVYLPGPTLTAGPMQVGWHIGAGETQLQTALLDIGNSGGGNLKFTAESSATWLTLSRATGAAPGTLTLTANPVGFSEGVTREATVTLSAQGNPSQIIKIPVTLSMGNTFGVDKPSKQVDKDNSLLDCSQVIPSRANLWPANGSFVKIVLSGITGPTLTKKNQNFDLQITAISQDEPLQKIELKDKTSPDAKITRPKRTTKKPLAKDVFYLRAERQGVQPKKQAFSGNGRSYQVSFTANDGSQSCNGSVKVQVPPTRNGKTIDNGQLYDATQK